MFEASSAKARNAINFQRQETTAQYALVLSSSWLLPGGGGGGEHLKNNGVLSVMEASVIFGASKGAREINRVRAADSARKMT